MVCKNCHKEIGQRSDCSSCGYDPALDGPNAPAFKGESIIQPPPVKITLKKQTNSAAILGFIFSLLFWSPVSLILGIAGFKQAKVCRSGRGLAICAIIFSLLQIAMCVAVIVASMSESGVIA